jgi:cytosine/creatinine deaminase
VSSDCFLQVAPDEAREGLSEGAISIESVLVCGGRIIGRGHNQRMQKGSVIHHGDSACRYRRKCDVQRRGEFIARRWFQVEVLQDEECIRMMCEFIAKYPELWNEDIGV